MKSRISIDVDQDNQPVIKIEYSPSEDVRDKLVKKFLESFDSVSWIASLYYINEPGIGIHGQTNSTAILRPVPVENFRDEIISMKSIADQQDEMIKKMEINSGSPIINGPTTTS